MPEVDQITRPNDQSEQSRPDKIQQRKSPVDRTPELPTDRHETPSIAPRRGVPTGHPTTHGLCTGAALR